ncbi:hypothetical protein C8R45DRAFT_963443 [Mycena sanguinolenta]|nr:hypothetical protein C8R45DRAFT_963443 [Mycena sanguinolenta]
MSSTPTFELSTAGFLSGACTAIIWLLFQETIKHVLSIMVYALLQTPLPFMAICTGLLDLCLNIWRLVVLYEIAVCFVATVALLLDEEDTVEEDTDDEFDAILGAFTEDNDDPSTLSGFIAVACAALIWILAEDHKVGFALAISVLLNTPSVLMAACTTIFAVILNLMRLVALFEAVRYIKTTVALLLEAEDTDETAAIPGAYIIKSTADDKAPRDPLAMETSESDETLVHEVESDSPVDKRISAPNPQTQDVPPLIHDVIPEFIPPSDLSIVPSIDMVTAVVSSTPEETFRPSATGLAIPLKKKSNSRFVSKAMSSVRRVSRSLSRPTPFLSAVKSSSLLGC